MSDSGITRNSFSTTALILLFLICASLQIEDKSFRLVGLCEQNIQKEMGCILNRPVTCRTDADWVLLFYNSSNVRQDSTFQYLVPGFAKELLYAKQYHREFVFPPTGIIDCYTCPGFCNYVSEQDLPLVLYKKSYNQLTLRYKGYVSLPGLISFIKSHDPLTSYLAEEYEPTGQLINKLNRSDKEIKNILMKIRDAVNSQKIQVKPSPETAENPKQEEKTIEPASQQQPIFNSTIDEPKVQIQKPIPSQTQQPEQLHIQTNQNTKTVQTEQQSTQFKEETPKKEQPKKKSSKGKKSKANKKQQKGQKLDFLTTVQGATDMVVQGFAYLGFGGIILSFIGSICYAVLFVILGLLWILVNVL